MQEFELNQEMAALGLPVDHHDLLKLLPLVEVAWADSPVEPEEIELIRQLCLDLAVDPRMAEPWLQRWCTDRPPQHFFDLGREVLCELVARHHGVGITYPPDVLPRIEACCYAVARHGGFWALSEAERTTMQRINVCMTRLLDELDFDPGRPGLGWGTLAETFRTRPEDPTTEPRRRA